MKKLMTTQNTNGNHDAENGNWDVLIVGGGVGGPTAGIFLARAGLRCLIFDRGKSSIKQCAFLDNYPGFPEGIGIDTFLRLIQAQAVNAGCTLLPEKVKAVRHEDDDFIVETKKGERYTAPRVISASQYDMTYLEHLPEADKAIFAHDEYFMDPDKIDEYGRCGVPGLYIASPRAGFESQAIITAGHAARVALGIIKEQKMERGWWSDIARTTDWLVYEGRYGSDKWYENIGAYYRNSVPADRDPESAEVKTHIAAAMQEDLDKQISKKEAKARARKAQLAILSHLDGDIIRDYAEQLSVCRDEG